MYLFDPTPLQIALAAVAMASAGFLAAWLVSGDRGGRDGDPAGEGARPEGAGDEELATLKKAILWTAAAGAAIFLLWWATLSAGSGGRPAL